MTGAECCLSAGGSSLQDGIPAFLFPSPHLYSMFIIIAFRGFVKPLSSRAGSMGDPVLCLWKPQASEKA